MLLIKINRNILINIRDISGLLVCIITSLVIFLIIIVIMIIGLLGKFQKLEGINIVNKILTQFRESKPVAGSNTEKRFSIIFNIFFY